MTKLARWKMSLVSHDIFRVHEPMTCLTDSDIPRSRLNSLSTPWWMLAINVKLHHTALQYQLCQHERIFFGHRRMPSLQKPWERMGYCWYWWDFASELTQNMSKPTNKSKKYSYDIQVAFQLSTRFTSLSCRFFFATVWHLSFDKCLLAETTKRIK